LFPYSTTLVDGRLLNVYDHPQAIRYTVNSLLGLAEAARHGIGGVSPDDVGVMTERILADRPGRVEEIADVGLLAVHLAESGVAPDRLDAAVSRLDEALRTRDERLLDLQTLSWVTWGMSGAAARGVAGADRVAQRAAETIAGRFVDAGSVLPRHSTRWYRKSIVSFGSVTYFLRAAYELATVFGEDRWRDRFRAGIAWALQHQGPRGEWPWLMDTRSGTPIDVYPVFSVHQDSMAMLFLLPALGSGMHETAPAIERSLGWGFGVNELGVGFYRTEPFLAHRSIERVESHPRVRRYLRSFAPRPASRAEPFGTARARVNAECRSYHLGWILYVWSRMLGQRASEEAGPA
jgi:hypothetical protein